MITIIDYGMGNLRSVQKAFQLFGDDIIVSSKARDIKKADKLVLPGVGAFKTAMDELKKRGLIETIKEEINYGKPFLGVCLGLQLLFTESAEGGRVKGLDVIKGKVRRFKESKGLKVPHMGWNNIRRTTDDGRRTILRGVPDGAFMYFVHSYYVEPEDKGTVLSRTDYGIDFVSGICKNNIYGFQFHPEKSQGLGLKIIKNFVEV